MPTTAAKKSSIKASKTSTIASKSQVSSHPSWVDMIKECIMTHPEDARAGVSRPTIKKFVESKYRIDLTASAASQLNRAITSGSEKGVFMLPKGPSGKVKLAPKLRVDASKENTKPVAKKSSAAAKSSTTATKAKSASARKPPTSSKKASTGAMKKSVANPTAKKLPAKKATTTKKTASAKKSGTVKKTSATKKTPAKKTITGEVKKPKSKPVSGGKARPTVAAPRVKPSSNMKSTVKAKPASKAKPTSKAKPSSSKGAPTSATTGAT